MHTFAVLTAIATWLLLIAGGLVTSMDAGLSVPDWPLSYGMWFPPMVGGIRYEHGHRMIAGVVAVMILILAAWLRAAEARRWVRRLGYAALAAVFLQALLGGLTVLLLLPPAISIAHASLGQAVLCLVVCIARATASEGEALPAGRQGAPAAVAGISVSSLRSLGMAVALLAALQLVLGAVVRHTGAGLAWHVMGAGLLLSALVAFSIRTKRVAGNAAPWRAHLMRLHALVGLQIALGLVVLAHRGSVAMRTAHVGIGALALAQAVLLAWEVVRWTSSARSEAAPAGVVAARARAELG